jgi:hypothetical protein
LSDDFWKLGRRNGTHVDDEVVDLPVFVEVHVIDGLKRLALDSVLKGEQIPTIPCMGR